MAAIVPASKNRFGKAVPGRIACRGDVIDASSTSGFSFQNLHKSIDNGSPEIDGRSRRPVLIINYADDFPRVGETEHRLQKIRAVRAV